MDDFNLRDMLAPPMRMQSDLPEKPVDHTGAMQNGAMVLAMGYVPVQQWQELYEPEEGFPRGTIFRQLDLPFEGGNRP